VRKVLGLRNRLSISITRVDTLTIRRIIRSLKRRKKTKVKVRWVFLAFSHVQ